MVRVCTIGLLTLVVSCSALALELSGRTLSGEEVQLPDQSASISALIVSFSRKAGTQASDWRAQLHQYERWQGAVYNVLVLEGAPRFVRALIRRSLRSDVPKDEHHQFVIVTQQSEDWRLLTGAEDDGVAHVLLLKKGGAVCGRHSGGFDHLSLEKVVEGCD